MVPKYQSPNLLTNEDKFGFFFILMYINLLAITLSLMIPGKYKILSFHNQLLDLKEFWIIIVICKGEAFL